MAQDIAIIDDEVVLGALLAEVLAEEGYPARAFPSGRACLEAMESGYRPRLIFLDLHMRGLSGAAFVRWVREGGDDPAIYVVSGSACPDDYPPAQDIQGVLAKPFDLERVLRIARQRLGPPARPASVAALG